MGECNLFSHFVRVQSGDYVVNWMNYDAENAKGHVLPAYIIHLLLIDFPTITIMRCRAKTFYRPGTLR